MFGVKCKVIKVFFNQIVVESCVWFEIKKLIFDYYFVYNKVFEVGEKSVVGFVF